LVTRTMSVAPPHLPILHVRGNHYEVGHQIGSTFREYIQQYVSSAPLLTEKLPARLATDRGREALAETEAHLRSVVPQYIRELEGMAEGAGVPFHLLLLNNAADAIPLLEGESEVVSGGCTTVIVTREGGGILGHNEDGPPAAVNRTFMVHVTIPGDSGRGEEFQAFYYPGSLPGRCFGVTAAGLVWSLNSVSPKETGSGGITHPFLARHLAGAGLEATLELAAQSANGCSLNMFQMGSGSASNLEVSHNNYSLVDIPPDTVYFHCNKYLRPGVEETHDIHVKSSIARHKVLDDLSQGHTATDVTMSEVRKWLGDSSHPSLPIYRDGTSCEDVLVTTATGIFDMAAGKMEVYVGNPATQEPIYTRFLK